MMDDTDDFEKYLPGRRIPDKKRRYSIMNNIHFLLIVT